MSRALPFLLLTLASAVELAAQPPEGGAGVAITSRSTHLTVAAGSALRTRPTTTAPVVTIVDEPVAAELIEERSGWRRLRIGTISGWLAPEGTDSAVRAGFRGAFEIDRERLASALALLPPGSRQSATLGVALHAPNDATQELERWVTVAHQTLGAWPGRLGVDAVALDGASVVFAPGAEEAGDVDQAPGSAGGGVALLRLGERTDEAIEALLVHELSHLASERTFSRPLPIWLEEGIAEWLAREVLASDGNTLPGTLRGDVTVEREGGRRRVDLSGPLADLARLAREAEAGTLPALDLWTAIPEAEFSAPAARSANYALAGSFVRFLFEADEERAGVLRELLASAAGSTEPFDVDTELDRRLGDTGELDRAFRAWLVEELDRQLVPAMP